MVHNNIIALSMIKKFDFGNSPKNISDTNFNIILCSKNSNSSTYM